MNWIECKKEMPMLLEKVLAIYWIEGDHRPNFFVAEYVGDETITMPELLGDDWRDSGCYQYDITYDAKQDRTWWAKQGWWAYSPVKHTMNYLEEIKIKYWMRLPKPPYRACGRDGKDMVGA